MEQGLVSSESLLFCVLWLSLLQVRQVGDYSSRASVLGFCTCVMGGGLVRKVRIVDEEI